MKTKLLVTGLAIMALTTTAAFAQNRGDLKDQKAVSQTTGGNFIDEDKNGVCDYYETNGRMRGNGHRMANFAAAQGRRGMAAGQGRGLRTLQGRGMGPGQGRGAAPGGKISSMKIKTEYVITGKIPRTSKNIIKLK